MFIGNTVHIKIVQIILRSYKLILKKFKTVKNINTVLHMYAYTVQQCSYSDKISSHQTHIPDWSIN